jgi:tRNA (guanine-N7-)-methyltransferase
MHSTTPEPRPRRELRPPGAGRPPPVPRPYYRSLAPLLLWQSVPRPVDWPALFGRPAPLALEIGVGNGEFLARAAAEHPERNHVGVEMRWASMKRALRIVGGAGVANVRLVLEDARPVLERMFAPRALERVFLLFPCPWRKERHARHRLLRRPFLELLNNRLADGGEMLLVTDWTPFFEWTLAQLPGTGLRAEARLVEPRFHTKYERKWSSLGQQRFHEVRLVKVEHRAAPEPEDVVLNPHHLPAVDLDRLVPQDEIGPITVTFKEVVRDRERGLAMVRAVVVEEPLTQHFWIAIQRAADGTWWITPARGCQLVPTAGAQRALDRLAECAKAAALAAGAR